MMRRCGGAAQVGGGCGSDAEDGVVVRHLMDAISETLDYGITGRRAAAHVLKPVLSSLRGSPVS
jgi:hypothetical protein